MDKSRRNTTTYGFKPATGLLQGRIRAASEARGFAQTRLLTHWSEIAGAEIARIATPVKIGYPRQGVGAVLTVLTTGAQAPMLEMQKERLCERVNACYGYRAISQVRITQTAPTGFAEGQARFGPAPKTAGTRPDPDTVRAAEGAVAGIRNDGLRLALASLGANVLAKRKP